jgi:hypothetical protein
VLEHVHRQPALVGERVERDDGQRQPEREEGGAVPPGEIRSPTSAEADRALYEEKRRDSG